MILIVVGGLVGVRFYLNRPAEKQELVVFAAASLSDVFTDLARRFEEENPDTKININFASSGALQIQIEQGAVADIFASAGVKQMDALLEKNLIDRESVQIFALNRMVVVTPQDGQKISEPGDLLSTQIREICIADPETVPAGQYAAAALKNLGLWDQLTNLIYAGNVRQVLQYVEQEEVDLGFVYLTDALISENVEVVYTLPQSSHPQIEYPIGLVEGAQQKLAESFIDWVLSEEGGTILNKYGFENPLP